ncbi:hypothetical protein SPRG_11454 [Saprolegnia parasitica CBS 223.65]|uniref:Fcf2 pre-rRNA processing C-terminal domain-containing protein n=1 Tax=Saprolegnia parasitica (strain CBS 223.65) TaxID=695850 RepID=A0A067C967_SAPPC|nr:hypothetical protein SPRG_11454 [Saprolegnia parasitica CBS 223.65]KDO23362.1 hypothetical protein SPRG_11454 [Saprolegnia parasitica CBS 223.65]|eukprot:XP_012205853.1 hypothetical protein SPRG_11454 [Saprolegnia parasitica CBS 223.65]
MVATRRSLRLSLGGTESTASASPPPRRASRGKAAAATDASKEAEVVKSEAKAAKKTAKKTADDVAPKARAPRAKRATRASLSKSDIDALAQVAQEVAAKEAAEEDAAKHDASARATMEVIDIVSEDDTAVDETDEAKTLVRDEAVVVDVSAQEEDASAHEEDVSAHEEDVSAQEDDVSAEEIESAEDMAADGIESAEEADVKAESAQDVVVDTSADEVTADETTADESMGDEAAAQEEVEEEASAVEEDEHIAMAPASDDEEADEEHIAMAPAAADDASPDADMEEDDDDDDLNALVGMAMASFQAPPPTSTTATSEAPLALVPSTLESGVSYDNLYMKFNGRKCARGAELVPERKLTEEVSQLHKQAAYKAKMDAANSGAHEKKVSQDRIQTSHKWFNMTSNEMTAEAKRDMQLIKLRNYLDPKRFYKSSDHKKGNLPKVFQVGTVIEGAAEYKSNRLSRKERQQTFTEEIMHDQAIRSYTKRKFKDIQAARANTSKHKKPFKKAKHYK